MKRSLSLLLLCVLAAAAAPAQAAPRDPSLPDIQHVWIVVLENKDYAESFGPDTEAPYLARELTRVGELLPNYFGTSHASLGNYITMVSGQAPNPDTQADCLVFRDVFPGVVSPADGQVVGQGCVYPKEAKTIADQLDAAGLRWRGYMEDMANTPGAPKTCRHPAIGAQDDTQTARAHDQYATRHNPFVYFHSIIDSPTCAANVVPLDQLTTDIKDPSTTPNFAFITPDLCNDAHDQSPCADGGPGGLHAADLFLRRWVPAIMQSPGFARHGMLIVTWDEANLNKTEACCDQQTGPNTPSPGVTGPGGGQTGTVVISPFVKPASVTQTQYNHYGLLRSLEDLFGFDYLGYAGRPGLKAFGPDVYNATSPKPPPATNPVCKAARSGKPVAGMRLRDRMLTFRGRRTARVTLTARANGRYRVLRKPRRVVACRTYALKMPKGTTSVTLRGAGRTQRASRTASGEHG
jgi:hypothetical protein